MNQIAHFKEKLAQGKPVLGLFMKTIDPSFVEIVGYAGYDFAILDMEHGPIGFETLQRLLSATENSGVLSIVRTQDSQEHSICKPLDLGCCAIQVPQIQDRIQAETVVKRAKFHPKGARGVCRFVRSAKFSSMQRNEYFSKANDSIVILQIEGASAIENIDEILSVDDVDIIFIGPYDLSQSLGCPGDINNPKVIKLMTLIVEKSLSRGKYVGTFVDTIENVKLWHKVGVQFFAYSVDVGMFYDALSSMKKQFSSVTNP